MTTAHRYLTDMAARITDWDHALIRQAVLVTAHLGGGTVTANDFRDYLPETSMGAVGLTIRGLPSAKHGALIRKARTRDGHPITEPSTAESTHGKPLQVWELTAAGRAAAQELVEGQVAA